MKTPAWWLQASDADFQQRLDAARREGDWAADGPNADQLVEQVARQELRDPQTFGRAGYHHLLDLANQILDNPELLLINQSHLNRQLATMPPEIVDYFDPMPAPDWVDPRQLEIASRVWLHNTITLLLILYASSLPGCYVIQKGIPVLYTTEKLRDRKNISQRLFETGFMLDDVMSPGGIRIIEDVQADGRRDRYLWGRGFLSAKKVRALHASMRLMLQYHPYRLSPEDAGKDLKEWPCYWDPELGTPINQEDMAYTLLTFGYLLPRGLETWGCQLSLEQKNAVLHLWKVTGYIMGLREDLMTDQWHEAEALFQKLLARGQGQTEQGMALTETVMEFVGGYFPKWGGLDRRLPASMIIDQCGLDMARLVMKPELITESQKLGPRLRYGAAKTVVKAYFFLRNLIIPRIPLIGYFLGNLLHGSGRELVESFRDSFVRQPFFIPKDSREWEQATGATEAFHQRLDQWRQTLFRAILASIVFLFLSLFSFAGLLVHLPLLLIHTQSAGARLGTLIFSIGTLVGLFIAVGLMKWGLPAIFRKRPLLPEELNRS